MCNKPVWKWINLAAFACMVLVNLLAEVLPLGGNTTGQVSAMYPSPLTPASFTFSIWGLIYIYLAVFILTQIIFKSKVGATEALGPWFLISCCANIIWIFTWHYRLMTLALISIAILLLSLIIIERKLRHMHETAYQRWLIRAPFSMYFGWITVAAIANISVWLSTIGFNGWGLPAQLWLTIVLLLGGAILCAGILVNYDYIYGLAGLWAYVGIMMHQLTPDVTGSSYFWSLSAVVVSCVAMVFSILIIAFAYPNMKFPLVNRIKWRTSTTEEIKERSADE